MKNAFAYTLVMLTVVLFGLYVSAQVDLIKFEPGTPISSAEVNANFETVADDLATRQVRVAGDCEVGSAVRAINADGTVECESLGESFYTKAEIDALLVALTGDNIVDESLRVSDLGGGSGLRTQTVGSDITLGPGQCKAQLTGNFGASVIGSIVVGTLSDASGDPVLPNTAAVIPNVVIGTTQGGAVPNLVTCNTGNNTLTIPAGSVFTWRLIEP